MLIKGHYKDTGEPIYLSGVGMSMYIGVSLAIVGMFTESLLGLIDYYHKNTGKCCGRKSLRQDRHKIKVSRTNLVSHETPST